MASPQAEIKLLRSVLSAAADGRADQGHIDFALNNTDEAQQAFDAYERRRTNVIEEVKAFIAGGCNDTTQLEKAFDELTALHGRASADRAAVCGPGKGHRPRRR